MNWYKESQYQQLPNVISTWLIQAYRGPINTQLMHQDIDMLMSRIDDYNSIDMAIQQGVALAQSITKQNQLTATQQQVISEIQNRVQGQQQGQNQDQNTQMQNQQFGQNGQSQQQEMSQVQPQQDAMENVVGV